MENVSRSINMSHSSASISKKLFGGSGFASKSLYNDICGGMPKFGTLAFSPSVEDYADIFGTFRAFHASSIPILDLPLVHEADATFDFQSSCFNYSDVFGASNSLNFAASYEELFKTLKPGGDDDSDEVWTPAQSELSDVSEAHINNTNAEKFWREGLHQSINMIPSGCNPQRDQLYRERFSNLQTHVSHLQSLSGIPIVDNQTHVLQNKYEHRYMSKSTEDSNTCNNFIRQADVAKFFRKTHSLPINSGGGNGKTIGNSNHETYSERKPQDIYEQSLGIGASVAPPQSRSPPELLDTGNQETCDQSPHHIISTNHFPETIPGYDSPPFYDTEVNASLFVATAAASIKEVMNNAQTKLRNAKKIMEKRKEVLQNCMMLELDTNVKSMEEEKPEFAHSKFSVKKMADTCAIKGNELGSFPPQEDKESVTSLGIDISEKGRNFNLSELSTPKNPGDILEKFDNGKYLTVNKCKHGTKIFVEEQKMSEENDSRLLNEDITTIQMEENHACVFSEVTDRESVKILEDQILPADQEKILILTALNLTNDNKLPETGNNDTVSSEEQKFKMVFEQLECCREEGKVANETWTRKNDDFELKIEKIKSAVNKTFKGTLSRALKTREDNGIHKSINIPQSSWGKQVPTIENEDNKKLMVGFKLGKNKKLQENGDSQSLYQPNLVKTKEYDKKEDVKNIEDGCHVHGGNEIEKRMEEAWVIAVNNEELDNREGVFEGENQEKCKKYVWHDAKVGLLQTQPFCVKVQHQQNGVHFLQSRENHVCLNLECAKIIDETSHEEAGGNVTEIALTKKLEQDIGVPGLLLGTSDDTEGNNTSGNCCHTWPTELVFGESSRGIDISRTEFFVHGSHTSPPHNENKENLADVLHVVSDGRSVSASEENCKVVGETIKSKVLLNMDITKGIQNQRIMGMEKMVQHVNNTYDNMQMNCNSQNIVVKDNDVGSLNRRKVMESDHRREIEEMERESEHKKDMIDVEITCDAKEKKQHDLDSTSGANLYTDSIKFGERMEKLQPGEKQYTVEFQSVEGVIITEARGQDAELKISDKSTCKAQERAKIVVTSRGCESRIDGIRSKTSFNGRGYSSGFRNQNASNYTAVGSESSQRHNARLERHQRTIERVGKALEEKNKRDLIVQQEKAERCRLAESLDADVKRWSNGKEGNLRALLSTLQYILGSESGWKAVTLTEVITSVGVKKAYRKATLCVHPDKLQQRGASIHDKYISEKVFDLLKEAWNRFNSEER